MQGAELPGVEQGGEDLDQVGDAEQCETCGGHAGELGRVERDQLGQERREVLGVGAGPLRGWPTPIGAGIPCADDVLGDDRQVTDPQSLFQLELVGSAGRRLRPRCCGASHSALSSER